MPLRPIVARPYTLILGAILIVMVFPHMWRHDEWTDVYLDTSRRLAAGQDIYPPIPNFVYPPFSAILFLPLAWVPDKPAQVIWYVASAIALVLLVKAAWSLSGGNQVDRLDAPAAEHVIAVLACLCAMRFAFNALGHLSLDLIIALMLMYGGLAAVNGRWMRTAIWWGFAAAFKGPPALFAGYLLWRRQWGPAFVMVVLAVALNLLPDLIHRPAEGGLWVQRWNRQYVQALGQADYTPGHWYTDILNNQSMAGGFNRWFLTTFSAVPDGIRLTLRPDAMSATSLRRLLYAVDAVICLIAAAVMMPGSLRSWGDQAPSRASLEISIVMLLILLFSPVSSPSLFCIMLLPAFCVTRAAVRRRDWFCWTCIVLATLASTASHNLGFARTFNREMLWLGVITISATMLLLPCVWLLASPPPVVAE
jgi:hypothetical protein